METPVPPAPRVEKPSFGEAFRYWLRLGFVNFGGPAGQIALMHEELVDRKRWIGHERFMHALNYCMLLPGPEAQQLAVYIGWLLHGTAGGVVAGTLFVLPGALLMLALSATYSLCGEIGWIKGLFHGLGPAVIAIVAAAVLRIGKRGLGNPALYALAAAAFVAIFFFSVPFPWIVLGAAVAGLVGVRMKPDWFKPAAHGPAGAAVIDEKSFEAEHTRPSARRALAVLLVHVVLWGGPVLALGLWRGWDDPFVTVALFFSIAAMVTFGGAYAVLSYVAQAAVGRYGWLGTHDMTVGLGLAESTPGPLILTVQFVGWMAGYNHAPVGWSPVAAGALGAGITLWVTFVPCFLWILLGAPYVERLRGRKALDGVLTAVTAAVVGVILNLAIWLALRVLFGSVEVRSFGPLTLNLPHPGTLDGLALVLALVAFVGIVRFKWNMVAVVLGSAAVGLAWALLGTRI